MELQCVESLAPDSFPSRHDPIPYYVSCPSSSLSPLTRSPSPSPKRRRLSHPPAAPPLPLQHTNHGQHPLQTLAERDVAYAVPSDHLQGTPVTAAMREEVVAWCGDMAVDLKLPEGIIATAVNLFDRFIAKQEVCKTVLYALTASCLLLACKLVLDDDVPFEEICARSRVALDDVRVMETVILNVLGWRVNVVTPHEVVNEIRSCGERLRPLQDSLMMNAMMDYRLAGLRATSIGVACYVLSDMVGTGRAYADHARHAVYLLAGECGVCLKEVDDCVEKLREGMNSLFELEEVDSEDEWPRLPENVCEPN